MSLVAARNTDPSKPFVSVEQIVREHWARFGRNYFSRYDYEEVDSKDGDEVMTGIEKQVKDGSLIGKTLAGGEGSNRKEYTVAATDNFAYTDPIDKSLSTNQVLSFSSHSSFHFLFTCCCRD